MRVPGRILTVMVLALAAAYLAVPAMGAPAPASVPAASAEDLFHAGDYVAAADRFAAALAAPDAPRALAAGRLHFDLGVCRLRLGQLAEAEYQMRRALMLIDDAQGANSAEGAAAREGLATVLVNQGNMIEAEEILQDALATRKALYGPGNPQTLRTLDLLASVNWLDGEPQKALALYEQVMSGLRAIHGNVHPLTATTAQNIGAVQMEINTDFSAEIMFRQAIFITESLYGSDHPEMTAPLCGMADIMTYAGYLDRAAGYYRRALAAVSTRSTRSFDVNQERIRALTGLARVLIAQDKVREAMPLLKDAVALHDELRAIAGGDMEAATIGGSPRALLAHALLLEKRYDEAWQVLEGGRGRLAVAWRASRGDSLQRRQLEIESAMADATDANEHHRLQQQWNECDAARAAVVPAAPAATVTPAQLGARLGSGDVLVGWLDVPLARGQRGIWTYAMAPGKPVTWRHSPDTAWKNSTSLLRRYRNAVAGAGAGAAGAHWGALADSVWTQRFGTVAKDLAGARRVLVVAAEPMGGIPLAPLGPLGGPSLLDRCEILAATSAVDFTRIGASPARMHLRSTLVVADPPYGGKPMVVASRGAGDESTAGEAMPDGAVLRSALGHNRSALGSLPRLTASRDEALAIRTAFPLGRTLLGADASEAGLERMASSGDLKDVGIIHLATHALVDCRAPDRSALVLADLSDALAGDDGLLTAREVRLGWVLDADLVTLSACETGLGRETDDDGMLSLTAAFFAAGARNVVSSLWKVEDQATAKLMAYFYEELSRSDPRGAPVTVGGALRAAQLRLRDTVTAAGTRPYAAPSAWGGFVAYGGAGRR